MWDRDEKTYLLCWSVRTPGDAHKSRHQQSTDFCSTTHPHPYAIGQLHPPTAQLTCRHTFNTQHTHTHTHFLSQETELSEELRPCRPNEESQGEERLTDGWVGLRMWHLWNYGKVFRELQLSFRGQVDTESQTRVHLILLGSQYSHQALDV